MECVSPTAHFFIIERICTYTEICSIICKRIIYLIVCNSPSHHYIRNGMSLWEHILDFLARPYVPIRYTVIYHVFLILIPFFAAALCYLSFTDIFHNLESITRFKSLIYKVCHNIISRTNGSRNCSLSLLQQSLGISEPYVRTMRKSCNTNKIRKCLWLSLNNHSHGKVCTKFRYSKAPKFAAPDILRLNLKSTCVFKQ